MKVALAQMDVKPGQPGKNLETMLGMISEAKKEHVDVIAFPELCISGYLVGDKWTDPAFVTDLMECNEVLRQASDGIVVAYGNVYAEPEKISGYHPNKDGRQRIYNAAYVFQNGKAVERATLVSELPEGVQPKTLLPTYRFFDDQRYFFSLEDIAKDYGKTLEEITQPFLVEINGEKVPIGLEICEDLWIADYRKNGAPINQTKTLIENGATKIFNLSSSPWTFGKHNARDKRIQFLKQESGDAFVPFYYVNCVGAQNNGKNIITFDGGTTVYDESGLPSVFANNDFQEELLIVNGRINPSERIELEPIAQKHKAIVRGLQHVKDMIGIETQPTYVIGMSGGVDSALVATLLTEVVGPEKVLGVNMPTQYNSQKTKTAARKTAEALGINYVDVPIEELVMVNETILETVTGSSLSSINKENVQAKIRGTNILSNLAAACGVLFTNNGNKLETALGYATLYGDVGGAIAPIADLTKTEVFNMARYINRKAGKEIIPESLFPDELFRFSNDKIAPTAELKEAQIDPMKFGYHDALLEQFMDYNKKSPEDIMQWYIDGTMEKNLGVSTELLERWNVTDPEEFVTDLDWFTRSIPNNVFKRVQTPPVIITSKTAYGYDLRESILPYNETSRAKKLKEEILEMKEYRRKK